MNNQISCILKSTQIKYAKYYDGTNLQDIENWLGRGYFSAGIKSPCYVVITERNMDTLEFLPYKEFHEKYSCI